MFNAHNFFDHVLKCIGSFLFWNLLVIVKNSVLSSMRGVDIDQSTVDDAKLHMSKIYFFIILL